jgi:hypothetical protein|tara:strand:+ start:350 stop:859 length:510 start_codon:yes stop_codon:yes gene_type:complete
MKRKMHEISTDIMTLQMGLDMKSPEERTIQLQDLFLELFDKEDGIYWLYVDNEKKVDMVKDHINKCKIVLNVIQRDNEQIKDLVINTHESLDSLPKHSIFNPIKIRNSSGAVLVEDESIIPKEYFVLVQEERLDKKRILKELKEGNKIPGVKLVKKPFVSGLKERSHNE